MSVTVKLEDIVEAMELQPDDYHTFLNKQTGECVTFSASEYSEAEGLEEDVDPQELDEGTAQALEYLNNEEDYVSLPDEYEIDEYEMMERFCLAVELDEDRQRLLDAIDGRGAFRRFKDLIRQLGLEDDWYQFRDEVYLEVARQWCEENEISYEE
jgi:hypothetical protein